MRDVTESIAYVFSEYDHLKFDGLDTPAKRKANADLKALGPETPGDFYCAAMYPAGNVGKADQLFKSHAMVAVRRDIDFRTISDIFY